MTGLTYWKADAFHVALLSPVTGSVYSAAYMSISTIICPGRQGIFRYSPSSLGSRKHALLPQECKRLAFRRIFLICTAPLQIKGHTTPPKGCIRYNSSHIVQKHRRVHTDIIAAVGVVSKSSAACSLLPIAVGCRGATPSAVRQLYFLVPCVPLHVVHAGGIGAPSVPCFCSDYWEAC